VNELVTYFVNYLVSYFTIRTSPRRQRSWSEEVGLLHYNRPVYERFALAL